MASRPVSSDQIQLAREAMLRNGGNKTYAAADIGTSARSVGRWLAAGDERGFSAVKPPKFTVATLPEEELPVEEIIAHRRKVFDRKQKATDARKLIPLTLREPGPIALTVFGDIHIDDDGCNWPKLQEDMNAVLDTDGMFAASIGDLQNGWVGRLARKWADQSTTGKQAWKLVEWWIKTMGEKLLFVCQGNHDAWTRGVNGISPLDWVMEYQPGISEADGIRLELRLPFGDPIIINARHDFAGRSLYNPAHGPMKAILFGYRDDDIAIAGHTHESGYLPRKNPATGKVTHAIRVASYKAMDDYAKERGFLDGNISESVVIMIDPHEPDIRHRIWIEFSVTRAARMLTLMRREWKKRAA